MIAALFVARGGVYFDPSLAGEVDPWDEARDARLYAGPHPVVAHPPCSRWCRLAGLVEARWGHRRGDDGGCFASALASVRRFGGVLEHPAYSDAWAAHDLPAPPTSGGWARDMFGGWSCYVEQGHYGHLARKPTWLYACVADPPPLRWSVAHGKTHVVSRDTRTSADRKAGVTRATREARQALAPRTTKAQAIGTPPAFRDALLAIAREAVLRPRDGT
jgi:hypothetical protein